MTIESPKLMTLIFTSFMMAEDAGTKTTDESQQMTTLKNSNNKQ